VNEASILSVWAEFLVLAGTIAVSGYFLSVYGDIIADRTGLGRSWIGLVLLASITSLPELLIGVTSVLGPGVIDIALGDALGSCVFNLTIIVLLDFLYRKESVYTKASQGHILSAGFGIILLGIVALDLFLAENGEIPAIGHIGLYTFVIIVFYLIAMRTLFRYERDHKLEKVEETAHEYEGITLKTAALRLGAAAAFTIAAGTRLPYTSEKIAHVMGWGETFVGSLFVAFTTSLPEIVVTVSALRIGALDMGIANLFGSNLFDVAIIAVDDLFYFKGPILAHAAPIHGITCVSAMLMTGIAIVGLLYRPKTRVLKTVGWTSIYLLTIYLLNNFLLFLYGK